MNMIENHDDKKRIYPELYWPPYHDLWDFFRSSDRSSYGPCNSSSLYPIPYRFLFPGCTYPVFEIPLALLSAVLREINDAPLV